MAQEIEVRLESFTDDERHKIAIFVDALRVAFVDRGWASWADFDDRAPVKPGNRYTFRVTTRRKLREALALVENVIVSHMMGLFTTVTHRKVEDG